MNAIFNLTLPIAIGADHAGYEYKEAIKKMFTDGGFAIADKGCPSTESVDYPDYAHPVATMVENGEAAFGILLCGSANGVAITANKHQGLRAALCWENEVALMARKHNNANILCLPARFTSLAQCKEMILSFMHTPFDGGRHQTRVEKIKVTN